METRFEDYILNKFLLVYRFHTNPKQICCFNIYVNEDIQLQRITRKKY